LKLYFLVETGAASNIFTNSGNRINNILGAKNHINNPFFAERLFSTALDIYRYGFAITSPISVSSLPQERHGSQVSGEKQNVSITSASDFSARDILKSCTSLKSARELENALLKKSGTSSDLNRFGFSKSGLSSEKNNIKIGAKIKCTVKT
jgi:hypothetical protein